MLTNVITLLLIVWIIAAALLYIRKEKKRGVTCIGCPYGADCAKRKQGGCSADTKSRT